jgi:hypothetical protein
MAAQWSDRQANKWWAEGGSVRWLWDQAAFKAAFEYVTVQRREERTRRAARD